MDGAPDRKLVRALRPGVVCAWICVLGTTTALAATAQHVGPLRGFSVRIVSPTEGELVGGRMDIRAEVRADRPAEVLAVEFEVDGRVVFSDAHAPYELIWNTRNVTGHRIVARAIGPTGRTVEAAVHTAPPPDTAAGAAFRSRVDQVEVYVRVEGRHAAEPLAAADFRVYEDDTEQSILAVERSRDLPLALGFMVDCSGSMVDRLGFALKTAGSFIDGLMTRDQDKAFVMAFADLPSVLQEFTNDVGLLDSALDLINRGRYTKLYDAVTAAAGEFRGHEGRRALVLLTDGHDAGSEVGLDDAVRAAQEADVAVYPVAVDLSSRFYFEHWVLEQMARRTGGRLFELHALDDPGHIYRAIAEDLTAQYRITYEPSDPVGSGEWRPIEVRLASEATRRGTRVRSRPGYFAR